VSFFFNVRKKLQLENIVKQFLTEILLRCKSLFPGSRGDEAVAGSCIRQLSSGPGKCTVPAANLENFAFVKGLMLIIILTVFALLVFHCNHLSDNYRAYNSKSK